MAYKYIFNLTPKADPDDTDEFEVQETNNGFSRKVTRANILKVGTLVQAHSDVLDQTTAPFTTALKTKLNGIAAGAQVNPTAAQIKTLYESNGNTNALTDALLGKLNGLQTQAQLTAAINKAKTDAIAAIEAKWTAALLAKLKALKDAAGITAEINAAKTAAITAANAHADAGIQKAKMDSFILACCGEIDAPEAGADVALFEMPYNFTVTGWRASVNTAAAGSAVTVNIKVNNVNKKTLSIAAGHTEVTSTGTVAVTVGQKVSVDVTAVDSGGGSTGLKVYLIGYNT